MERIKYDLKWKNDLAMYVKTFGSFVFEGNVNDLQPLEDGEGGYTYHAVKDVIAKIYGEEYCVVFFDHTKQSGRPIDGGDDADAPVNPEDVDDSWFNSFEFFEGSKTVYSSSGERIPSPNIELFKQYYMPQYLERIGREQDNDLQERVTVDMGRMLAAMKEFETNAALPEYADAKPFMFILPDVSRYMTTPGRPDRRENAMLMLMFAATQLTDSRCKLLMFVDKMNDLPTWFESENSNTAIKKIFLPLPDGAFRETFYRLEMRDVMDPVEKDEDEKISKFSAYTERYSLRRLLQLRDFIVNEDGKDDSAPSLKRLENIDKTVLRFDVGQNRNPWRDSALRKKISELPAQVGKEVQGQPDAIARVTDTLRSAVTGVNSSKKNDRRPRAVFFFAGPTGTGKTELSKQIAECIFDRADKIIRFDMSEFREEHSDARLFGAPPGYVGYEAGGELTRAIKQDPFSIVLFDEIEKAAPRIWDKFLQILGDGRLTDGKGETVSFTQSIIVFTSNLGITADAVSEFRRHEIDAKIAECNALIEAGYANLGAAIDEESGRQTAREIRAQMLLRAPLTGLTADLFSEPLFQKHFALLGRGNSVDAFNDFVSDCVKGRVKSYFDQIGRREVLGRIGEDNILVFNFIEPDIASGIADHTIDKYIGCLKEDGDIRAELTVTEDARKLIKEAVQRTDVINLGGRGIVTEVEKLLRVPVGRYLFDHEGVGLKFTLGVGRGNKLAVL